MADPFDTFVDELVQMHDEELSLPTMQLALERHLAGRKPDDIAAERQRLAEAFRAKRHDTILAQEVVEMILGGNDEV